MSITISITSGELDDNQIEAVTRDLCNSLNREIDFIDAKLPEQPAEAGFKGFPFDVGTIVLTLIGSGGIAVSLVNVFKAYIDRNRQLKIRLKGSNGQEIEIDATNMTPTEIEQTAKLVQQLTD